MNERVNPQTRSTLMQDVWQQRVPPGYPNRETPKGKQQNKQIRVLQQRPFGQAKAKTSQAAVQRELRARQYALSNPYYQWQIPVYEQFMGQNGYPANFNQVYGYGPQKDHYYPGLTPRDVLLSMGSLKGRKKVQNPLTSPSYGAHQLMRQREIGQSRTFMNQLAQVFYQGQIPTNSFLMELMNRLRYAITRLSNEQSLSVSSQQVLNAFMMFLDAVEQLLMQKNGDELLQQFIHHSVLAAMVVAETKTRLRQFSAFESQPQPTQQLTVGSVGTILAQSGPIYQALGDVISLFREFVGAGSVMQQTQTMPQMPTKPVQQQEGYVDVYPDGQPMYQPARQDEYSRPTARPMTPVPEPYVGMQPLKQNLQPVMESMVDYVTSMLQPLDSQVAVKILEDARTIIGDVGQDQAIRQVVSSLTDMVLELGSVSGNQMQVDLNGIPLLQNEANRQAAMEELKVIVERFTNHSLDPLISVIDQFQIAFNQDFPLRDLISSWQSFVYRCLESTEYMAGTDYIPKGIELLNQTRRILASEYGQLVNVFVNELFMLVGGFLDDPVAENLSQSVQNLIDALLIDPLSGQYTLKSDMFKDVRTLLVPSFVSSLRYVPLPRIEVSDDKMDLAIDNLVLNLENIVPNLVEFTMLNSIQSSPRPELPSAYFFNIAELNIIQIQASLQNVEFFIRRKGFLPFQDSGLADLLLGGNGLSVHMKVAVDQNLWYATLIPLEIKVTIDEMRLNLHDSQHDMLYKLMGRALLKQLKKRLCRSVEEQIFMLINRLDGIVTELIQKNSFKPGKSLNVW